MIITNISPKGRFLHLKISGFSSKVWLESYGSIELPAVTERSQLNLNAHEEAIIKTEENTGVKMSEYVAHDEELFDATYKYKLQATVVGVGGTTSLSAMSLSVQDNLGVSFSIYPSTNYYISAYTINAVNKLTTISNKSASTTTVSFEKLIKDTNVKVGFSPYGA